MDRVSVLARPGSDLQASHQHALAVGLRQAGIEPVLIASDEAASTRTVACWGWRVGQRLRARGHEVLVMERGYLGDRFAWTSLGWNGLNGRATFATRQDGGARFRQHFGDLLKPWNPAGEYVLLVGQVPGDMSLQGRDLTPWYAEQARAAGEHYGLPVVFRPHPVALQRGRCHEVPGTHWRAGPLDAALKGAAVVVTFNSNTGVDALLEGKPTTSDDCGSMVWEETNRLTNGCDPGREEWVARLAWCQWTLDEIRSGEAVDVVFSGRTA